MSVILDALKRVQDENRRRGLDPSFADDETVRDADAMVERLRTPVPGRLATIDPETRRMSPVVWVATITLCSVAVIASALWWFEPDFAGAQVNGARPLLADLSGNEAATRQTIPGAVALGAMTAGDQDLAPDAARPMPTPSGGEVASGEDLSDLSRALPRESSVSESEARDQPPTIDLRVRERSAVADSSRESALQNGGTFSLTSSSSSERMSTPAARQVSEPADWGRPGDATGNPFAARAPVATSQPPTRSTLLDPSVRAGFERGLQLQKAGDLSGAEDAYLRALKRDPNNAQINANLAVVYEALGRFSLAERHLRQAINVAPKNPSTHNNLGVVLYRVGNYSGAMLEFNRALSLDSGQLDAYTNKGLIFMRWGRYDDAQRSFRQVLVLDPDNALAHYNLGLAYEETQQWDMAIDSYYRFLDTGGLAHPDIVRYVSDRLPWVEARLSTQ